MTAPTRPVLRYHGGKWRLAPWIIGFFPPHRVYVEPFGGAASVLLRKPRASFVEIYNDLDAELVNLFRVLRDPADAAQLQALLTLTPYAREEFELAYQPAAGAVEQARRTVVRAFMGFGSDAATGALTGFRANGNRHNSHPVKDWGNYPAALAATIERLRHVVIENRDAAGCIAQHDSPQTLVYADPTYVPSTRSRHTQRKSKGYRHEMSESDHVALAEQLHGIEGMAVVSGYACDLYDQELYRDWIRHERPAFADGALPRREVVWLNPACAGALEVAA